MNLSPRQAEIVAILAADPLLGYKGIAARMQPPMTPGTVRDYVRLIAAKLPERGFPLHAVRRYVLDHHRPRSEAA